VRRDQVARRPTRGSPHTRTLRNIATELALWPRDLHTVEQSAALVTVSEGGCEGRASAGFASIALERESTPSARAGS